jgi:dsRNA-specific ribonuclease
MKEFNQNGITLVFYQKPADEKFSFLIKDNEELTEQLIANVSTKRVKEKDIKYAVKGIFEKIEQNLLVNKNQMESPIEVLGLKCQKKWGKNIHTELISCTGPSHNPLIKVKITLPNGKIYFAEGYKNQKILRQEAAEKALLEL